MLKSVYIFIIINYILCLFLWKLVSIGENEKYEILCETTATADKDLI